MPSSCTGHAPSPQVPFPASGPFPLTHLSCPFSEVLLPPPTLARLVSDCTDKHSNEHKVSSMCRGVRRWDDIVLKKRKTSCDIVVFQPVSPITANLLCADWSRRNGDRILPAERIPWSPQSRHRWSKWQPGWPTNVFTVTLSHYQFSWWLPR